MEDINKIVNAIIVAVSYFDIATGQHFISIKCTGTISENCEGEVEPLNIIIVNITTSVVNYLHIVIFSLSL